MITMWDSLDQATHC